MHLDSTFLFDISAEQPIRASELVSALRPTRSAVHIEYIPHAAVSTGSDLCSYWKSLFLGGSLFIYVDPDSELKFEVPLSAGTCERNSDGGSRYTFALGAAVLSTST
jgi:hypothetical protein